VGLFRIIGRLVPYITIWYDTVGGFCLDGQDISNRQSYFSCTGSGHGRSGVAIEGSTVRRECFVKNVELRGSS